MRIAALGTSLALAAAVLVSGPVSAATTPQVTVDPSTVAIGESAQVSATGLGDLTTVTFGMDTTEGAAFVGDGVGPDATIAEVPAADGAALIEFTATESGAVTVTVGTGQSVLATAVITVTAATSQPAPEPASPSPTASPSDTAGTGDDSAQAEPEPEVDGGRAVLVLFSVIAAAVVVVGGVIVLMRSRRGRRGD